MDIIYFVIYSRIKSLFGTSDSEWTNAFFKLAFICINIISGILFGSIVDSNKINFGIIDSRTFVLSLIVILIFVFNFFPSYIKRANIVSRFYPISNLKRQLINVTVELLSIPKMALYAFLIGLFFSSRTFSAADLALSFLLILSTVAIIRLIKGYIDYGLTIKKFIFLAIIIGVSIAVIFINNLFIRFPLICIIIYASNVLDSKLLTPNRLFKDRHSAVHSTSFFPFCISNVKVALVWGLSAKVVLLLLALNRTDEVSIVLKLLVISPITIFTYVYNNTWGFYRGIWHQTQVRANSTHTQLKLYLSLLLSPILIDATFTFSILALFDQINTFYIYVYLTSLINFVTVGFIVSVKWPVNVREGINPFKIKASSSVVGMIADFFLMTIIWTPRWHPIAFGIVLAITTALIICSHYFMRTTYSSATHRVFDVT